jgi:two-component system, sensor histidine kinase
MDAISKLKIQLSKPRISLTEKLRVICSAINSLIPSADRVSLWVFDKELTEIKSLILLTDREYHFAPIVLNKSDFPQYFEHILKHETLMASDAREHPSTACFNDLYFEPNDIHSLLDFVIQKDFEPIGIICCEAVGDIAFWQQEDVEVMKRIAQISDLFLGQQLEHH